MNASAAILQALLLTLILSILSACDGPIDLVDPYDRVQGEPSGQSQTLLDTAENEPEETTVAVGAESGGAGGETHEAADETEGEH